MIQAPILFITFNRPGTTQIVFNALKKVKPAKLYVFNDGPRLGNDSDKEARNEISRILNQVDWDCELKVNLCENNLGCGIGVSTAISWAFNNEDRLIVLEDDTVPAVPFYNYCSELLEKYKDDSRICMISGNNYTEEHNGSDNSYFFSKYGHIWGWATWKRVWDKFDLEMKDWPFFKDSNQLQNIFSRKREQRYFNDYFKRIYDKKCVNAWGPQWFYCRIKNYGFSIVPRNNLVTNIGVKGVHTGKETKAHFKPINEHYIIVKEPKFILCNEYYDKYHFKQIISKKGSLIYKIIRKSRKIVNSILERS